MTQTPGPAGEGHEPPSWQSRFVEQAASLSDLGLPRSVVRVLAWLVVSEPAHQSAEDLQAALRLSAGSVSAALATLVRSGVIMRRNFPGQRRTYYEMRVDGWQRLLTMRLDLLAELRSAAERAMKAAETAAGRSPARLQAMHRFYAACEAQLSQVQEDDRPVIAQPTPSKAPAARRKRGGGQPPTAQPERKRAKKGSKGQG